MAREIPQEIKDKFLAFCRAYAPRETMAEEEATGRFCTSMFEPFNEEDENGKSLWEFHAANYDPDNTYDIYELFQSVSDKYLIEQHGYDDFYIVPANSN